MKRLALTLLALVCISTGLSAQGPAPAAAPLPLEPGASQADVDKAVLGAPAGLRDQAMVIKWKTADWTYETLRKGTNQIVCFDKSGLAGQRPFSLECTAVGNLPRAAQNMKFESEP